MNRRQLLVGGLSGLLASSAVLGAQAASPPRVLEGPARVPWRDGWLVLKSDESRLDAFDGRGRLRWRSTGLGVPRAVVAGGGHVFVSDAQGVVHVLDDAGRRVDTLNGFRQPWGLVHRPDGLHVADRQGHHIVVVSPTGARRTYGEGLNGPAGLAADGARTWVADGGNERVVRLDSGGRVVQAIRRSGTWRPRAVAVSGEHILAASAVPMSVCTFDRSGRLLDEGRLSNTPTQVSVVGHRVSVS